MVFFLTVCCRVQEAIHEREKKQKNKKQIEYISDSICHFLTAQLSSDCLLRYQRKTSTKLWLRNATTMCRCNSNLHVECVTRDRPACMDISGTIRSNGEEWFNSSCVKCICVNGSISCSKADVNISYGLFKVNKYPTCERCYEPLQKQEAISACEGMACI